MSKKSYYQRKITAGDPVGVYTGSPKVQKWNAVVGGIGSIDDPMLKPPSSFKSGHAFDSFDIQESRAAIPENVVIPPVSHILAETDKMKDTQNAVTN